MRDNGSICKSWILMRLLQILPDGAFSLGPDVHAPQGPYAILSHTWGAHDDEVTFNDMVKEVGSGKPGYDKIRQCAEQVRKSGLRYFWVDTCCINKDSSAELSEAINSMYTWYQNAKVCYVYLCDVEKQDWKVTISASKWFTRGWTLQELLAPAKALFYDRSWQLLGTKETLTKAITSVTRIPAQALMSGSHLEYSVAQKMSWASRRVTTRVEDQAYSLLGLFDVNMPLIYGEGYKAFLRLQEEIIKHNDDHSIFAWPMFDTKSSGLFALGPECFSDCWAISSRPPIHGWGPFAMTNRGVSIELKIAPWTVDHYLAYIGCTVESVNRMPVYVGIFLRRLSQNDQYTRVKLSGNGLWRGSREDFEGQSRPAKNRLVYIRQNQPFHSQRLLLKKPKYGFKLKPTQLLQHARIKPRNPLTRSYSATLHPGQWGPVMSLEFSRECSNIGQAVLGFDFEFNPVCLLRDSDAGNETPDFVRHGLSDWLHLFTSHEDWEEDCEEPHILRRAEYRGLRLFVGHRTEPVEILIDDNPLHRGKLLLRLERDANNSQPYWEFGMTNVEHACL